KIGARVAWFAASRALTRRGKRFWCIAALLARLAGCERQLFAIPAPGPLEPLENTPDVAEGERLIVQGNRVHGPDQPVSRSALARPRGATHDYADLRAIRASERAASQGRPRQLWPGLDWQLACGRRRDSLLGLLVEGRSDRRRRRKSLGAQ